MQLHERIFELAITRSFFIPSNEPYGSVSGFYDYGPSGVLMKRKIEDLWRRMFIKNEGFHEVETSIMTPEQVLVASGHVASFADPVVQCQKCGTRVRADTLVEEKHYSKHGEKWDGKLESLDAVIQEKGIACPSCEGALGNSFMFNLMFKSGIGADQAPVYCRPETAQGIFTAFPRLIRNHGAKLPIAIGQVGRSFRNEISPRKGLVRMREFTQMELEYFFNPSQDGFSGFDAVAGQSMNMKVDGIVSKMSAKEVVSRGIASNEIMAYFLVREWEFYKKVGIKEDRMVMRLLGKGETPHYSKSNIDMEVETSFGEIETIGNAYRTDFDLSSHAKQSGKEISVFIEEEKRKITPHVFELSMGVDRLIFCILEHCFRDKEQKRAAEGAESKEAGAEKRAEPETLNPGQGTGDRMQAARDRAPGAGKEWEWFDFPPIIAPYHAAVFPLMKKDGHPEKASEIASMLREAGFDILLAESGSIGKRYARADEIGIPYALTIDYQTIEDGTVTIRYRNDGKQERVQIEGLDKRIWDNVRSGRVTI